MRKFAPPALLLSSALLLGAGETPPKPTERTWTVKADDKLFTFEMKPGIPDPDQVTEIHVVANTTPKVPHPRYGNRVPLEDARLTVEVTSPSGEVVARYLAHPIPLSSGKYGFHFTPKKEGLFGLALRGTTADGQPVAADLKLPVKVWPLPAELQGSGDAKDARASRTPIKL